MTLPDLCLINYTLTDKKFIDYKLWWYEVKSSGIRESKYHTMKCKLYNCNKLFTYTNLNLSRTKQITDRFHLSCDAISSVVLDQVYFLIESSTLWRELKLIIISCILVKIAKVLPFEQFQGQVGSFRMTHLVQKKQKIAYFNTAPERFYITLGVISFGGIQFRCEMFKWRILTPKIKNIIEFLFSITYAKHVADDDAFQHAPSHLRSLIWNSSMYAFHSLLMNLKIGNRLILDKQLQCF